MQALERGRAFAVVVDGTPEGLFGVSAAGQVGVVWMLGTEEMTRHAYVFLADAPWWLAELGKDFAVIGNYVWLGNQTHIKWLKRLGFEFFGSIDVGPDKETFVEFAQCVMPERSEP